MRYVVCQSSNWTLQQNLSSQVRSFELIDKDVDPEVVWHGGGGGAGKRDLDVTVGDGVDYDDAEVEGDDGAGTGERTIKDKFQEGMSKAYNSGTFWSQSLINPRGFINPRWLSLCYSHRLSF